MYRNIILTGGSCAFPNLAERLEWELGNWQKKFLPNVTFLEGERDIYVAKLRAFNMVAHPRLGSASPARSVPQALRQQIAEHLPPLSTGNYVEWAAAAMVTDLPTFNVQRAVTLAQYEEHGPLSRREWQVGEIMREVIRDRWK